MYLLDVIVGVNKYKLDKEEPLEVRSIDNSEVLEIQVKSLCHTLVHTCTFPEIRTR